jgi:hypothetical protein
MKGQLGDEVQASRGRGAPGRGAADRHSVSPCASVRKAKGAALRMNLETSVHKTMVVGLF